MSLLKVAHLQKIEVKLKRHKLIWNTTQDFANSGVIRGEWGHTVMSAGASTTYCHLKTCFKADI